MIDTRKQFQLQTDVFLKRPDVVTFGEYNATNKHSLTNYLYRHVANYKDVSAQTIFKSVLKLKGEISFKTILYYIKLSFTKLMLD